MGFSTDFEGPGQKPNIQIFFRLVIAGIFKLNKVFFMNSYEPLHLDKNSAEVDIAPASGKITKNVKYRSRAPG